MMSSTVAPGILQRSLNIANEHGVHYLYQVGDNTSGSSKRLPFNEANTPAKDSVFSAAKIYKKRRGQIEEFLARVSRE
jgi:hypothetical protein